MAVEAAIEALQATLDLVSQIEMGQALQALRSFEPSPASERFFYFLTNSACFFFIPKHKNITF